MPSASVATPSPVFCEWFSEPNHRTLHHDKEFVWYGGHLCPNGATMAHAHRHPTAFICFLSAEGLKNYVYPIQKDQVGNQDSSDTIIPLTKGAIFNTVPPVDKPYVHAVTTGRDPVLFAGLEVLVRARRDGSPAPGIHVSDALGVQARSALDDSTFSSAVSLSLEPGAASELRTSQTAEDQVVARVICRIDGAALKGVHVRAPGGVRVQYFEYSFCEPGYQSYLVTGFAGQKGSDALCGVHNLAEESVELAVVDIFKHVQV